MKFLKLGSHERNILGPGLRWHMFKKTLCSSATPSNASVYRSNCLHGLLVLHQATMPLQNHSHGDTFACEFNIVNETSWCKYLQE